MIDEISRRLADYQPHEIEQSGLPRAAVLIPLHKRQGDWHVVLTKRSERVEHHKGEISFPGGSMDSGDPDLAFTALRESDEEIGLRPEHVRIIGRVDDIVTISRFHITAFVGAIDSEVSPYAWQPQSAEVAEVFEIPLDHLLDAENRVELPRQRDGRLQMMEGFRFEEHIVWGSTARMLRNFLEVSYDLPALDSLGA